MACQQKIPSFENQINLPEENKSQEAWSLLKFASQSPQKSGRYPCEIVVRASATEPVRVFKKVTLQLETKKCSFNFDQLELRLTHKQVLSRLIKIRFSPDYNHNYVAETVFTEAGPYEVTASTQIKGRSALLLSEKSSAWVQN